MAVYDGFFDAVQDEDTGAYDRTYGSDDFARYFGEIIGSGVCVTNDPDSYKVTISDGKALINPGYIFIKGYWQRIESEPYSIDLTGTSPLAIAATLSTAKRMIELEAIPVAESYPDGTMILAVVDQAAGTVQDTRYDTTLCGMIDSMGGLSDKAAYAINYIDTQINTKLEQIEKEIKAREAEVDKSVENVGKVVDKITLPPVGTLKFSAAHDMGAEWLKCNGRIIRKEDYPRLFDLLLDVPNLSAGSEYFSIFWEASKLPKQASWLSVTYGDGVFVATSHGSLAAYSLDGGKTWSQAAMPGSDYWYGATYGNGAFVAVSRTGIGAYSEDGKTWVASSLPSAGYWNNVKYGNGMFVASAYSSSSYGAGSSSVAYSKNGRSWTKAELGSAGAVRNISYGNGIFIASCNEKVYWLSSDGIEWERLTADIDIGEIAHGNDVFVSVYDSACYSKDGKEWTASSSKLPNNTRNVAYGNGLFVATCGATLSPSNQFAYSQNGIEWETGTVPFSRNWSSISYGGGSFLSVPDYYSSGQTYQHDDVIFCNPFDSIKLPSIDISGVPAYIKAKETKE